jgi:hypothetical protein
MVRAVPSFDGPSRTGGWVLRRTAPRWGRDAVDVITDGAGAHRRNRMPSCHGWGLLEPSHDAYPGQPVDTLGATCFRTDGAPPKPSDRQERRSRSFFSRGPMVLRTAVAGRLNVVISCGSAIGYCRARQVLRRPCPWPLPLRSWSRRSSASAPWLCAVWPGLVSCSREGLSVHRTPHKPASRFAPWSTHRRNPSAQPRDRRGGAITSARRA